MAKNYTSLKEANLRIAELEDGIRRLKDKADDIASAAASANYAFQRYSDGLLSRTWMKKLRKQIRRNRSAKS